ncbi:MAG: aerial mycelium formation protein [Actinomycetota bacterium]|nr:aerial mycelium formation protein [Actinomycetota bacterium]
MSPQARREDRILSPAYLSDLESLSTAEVRSRRDECRELENELSYARRLLQGKIDILVDELNRRSEGGDSDVQDLVRRLPEILADDRAPVSQNRLVQVELPANAGKHRRYVERLATTLANIEALSHSELSALVEELTAAERKVSADRREAQRTIDSLNAELVRRYREGEEDPSALLKS